MLFLLGSAKDVNGVRAWKRIEDVEHKMMLARCVALARGWVDIVRPDEERDERRMPDVCGD